MGQGHDGRGREERRPKGTLVRCYITVYEAIGFMLAMMCIMHVHDVDGNEGLAHQADVDATCKQ